jgi:hypothetical protein
MCEVDAGARGLSVCVRVCVWCREGRETEEELGMQWVLLNVKVILFNRISIPTLSYNNIRT